MFIVSTVSPHSPPIVPGFDRVLDLLLIEDDPGDVFLVDELLGESGLNVHITVARTLQEARRLLTPHVQCIVADLSLPDASGLDLLHEVLAMAPHSAVVVLTGLNDAHVGVAAVAAGAEDFLVKQDIDGQLLARAIRYAIERKRAEESERQLVEARIRGQENARLERGLLPVPLIGDATLSHHTRYRPGRERALLGGDFYDTVQTPDGSVHLVIGDVCGHGPDEAALGVCLRMAWRTLVLAGHTGEQLLTTLDAVLGHERRSEEIFTTLCMVTVDPSRRSARMHRAGHPLPLLFGADGVRPLPDDPSGPALGLIPGAHWPGVDVDLGERWGLMLYTDGLIEGTVGDGPERLDTHGLLALAECAHRRGDTGGVLIDGLVTEVERLNGEALTDDLAVLLLRRDTVQATVDSPARTAPAGGTARGHGDGRAAAGTCGTAASGARRGAGAERPSGGPGHSPGSTGHPPGAPGHPPGSTGHPPAGRGHPAGGSGPGTPRGGQHRTRGGRTAREREPEREQEQEQERAPEQEADPR